jgi:phosphoribosyl 1,2-cyclic phosphodiesterase
LLDCGFSLRETQVRLSRLDRQGVDITAILLTHEHGDHCLGVGAVARRFQLPVWMTPGTNSAAAAQTGVLERVELFNLHEPFAIGDVEIHPIPVPHDAREPSQFVFSDGDSRLGFMTDLGGTTAHIERVLSGCDAIVIECNHDRDLLAQGDYPPTLKARVGGPHGHLDNAAAAEILSHIDTSRLRHVVAAHLSHKNNTPDLARAALSDALDCEFDWIQVADQELGLSWRDVSF